MIAISDLDFERFGYVTAKVAVNDNDSIDEILVECSQRKVEFLIARCPTVQLGQVQKMEGCGFFLADTLVYYRKKNVVNNAVQLDHEYSIRKALPEDASLLEKEVGEIFKGYLGHYHADPNLDSAKCDEIYSSWASNSCINEEFADHVILIIANDGQEIAAFATLKQTGEGEFNCLLCGVKPGHRGKGLFNKLLQLAQNWGYGRGLTDMLYSTQITNMAAQVALCRQGFEPLKSYYTFHKWFV